MRAGWPGGMVERGEVVVVELDLGALDDPVAHADEDVLELAPGGGDQVQVADRHGGSPGSVTSRRSSRRRCSSSARLERRGALLDQRLERPPGLVAALPTSARCSGGRSGIERRTVVSSALRPR